MCGWVCVCVCVQAYRKMALQHHPDKQTASGAEAEVLLLAQHRRAMHALAFAHARTLRTHARTHAHTMCGHARSGNSSCSRKPTRRCRTPQSGASTTTSALRRPGAARARPTPAAALRTSMPTVHRAGGAIPSRVRMALTGMASGRGMLRLVSARPTVGAANGLVDIYLRPALQT